jgi:dTDP-4-amino-4,6-dideoxygalactose transaminase|tara:strand:- start:1287 stop:2417 length:1131 start_codon:yes stop_codon:yes gene_type:complete
MKEIPFSGPDITDQEIKAVIDVIKSGWLAQGKYSKKLEQLFCEFTGAKYSTTISNCTAGLHLLCVVAEFGKGDEIIVPAQTHAATAHAVEYTGAKAVFADIDLKTGNISIDSIKEKLSGQTKGIIPVHMAGYPCNMTEFANFCDINKLVLIEDCAHALGTTYNGRHVGCFGIAGVFSFYPTKQVTTGEGGVVISNNKEIIDKVEKLKAFGIDTPPELRTKPGVYDVKSLGYNFRMTDIHAALGVGQMERYKISLQERKQKGKLYTEMFSGTEEVVFVDFDNDNSYFIFQLIFNKNIDRDNVLLSLKGKGIGVSIHYATPVPLMSYYKNKYEYKTSDFPNGVYYGNQSISLPTHNKINEEDVVRIVETVKETIKEFK